MSDVTRQDLKTILLCAIHLAKVDNEFHLMEKKILRRFSEAMGLQESEREELVAMTLVELDHLAGRVPRCQRESVRRPDRGPGEEVHLANQVLYLVLEMLYENGKMVDVCEGGRVLEVARGPVEFAHSVGQEAQ